MNRLDALKILGFEEKATPSPEDLKQAYRNLALKYHPDKKRDDENACKVFQEISEAYQCLMKFELSLSADALFEQMFGQPYSPDDTFQTFALRLCGLFSGSHACGMRYKLSLTVSYTNASASGCSMQNIAFDTVEKLQERLSSAILPGTYEFHVMANALPAAAIEILFNELIHLPRLQTLVIPDGLFSEIQIQQLSIFHSLTQTAPRVLTSTH